MVAEMVTCTRIKHLSLLLLNSKINNFSIPHLKHLYVWFDSCQCLSTTRTFYLQERTSSKNYGMQTQDDRSIYFFWVLSTKLNLLSGSVVVDFLDYLRRNQKILWDRHVLSRTGNDAALGDRASEGLRDWSLDSTTRASYGRFSLS